MYSELPALRMTLKVCWADAVSEPNVGPLTRTHPVEMEGMRPSGGSPGRDDDLNDAVRRERVHGAGGEKLLCRPCAAHNLQQHWDSWGYEGSAVHIEECELAALLETSDLRVTLRER